MANKTKPTDDVERVDLSNHKDKFTYRQMMLNPDTGAIYLQTFYCILGEPTMHKNQEIVPVIHLTQPDANGAQFATIDDDEKIKASIRDKGWKGRTSESQSELDTLLDDFTAEFQAPTAK